MTPQTLAKIRSHKFGRRKLTSDAAWTAYNKLIKDEANIDLIRGIASDDAVKAHVLAMNTALETAFLAAGVVQETEESPIVLTSPDKMFLPRSVYMGYITFPTGSLTELARTQFQAQEAIFADEAGKLRARIAAIQAAYKVLNDMGNTNQKPNPGGPVGAPHAA